MNSKIKFVFNPIAGRKRDCEGMRKVLEQLLSRISCHYEIELTQCRGDALQITREAVQQGFDLVVAVGGDGTVNEVATGLVNSNVCLGIIPIGSGNGLARGLNIPLRFTKACQVLCEGRPRRIDVGVVAGRYFFATTGFGFDAIVGKFFDECSRRGPLPYFYIGAREFFKYQPQNIVLKFERKEILVKALLVTVANTRQFGNGAVIAPYAQPDDGLLDISIIREVNALQAIYHLPKLFTGRIDRLHQSEMYRATKVEIIRPEPAPFHVDGEPLEGAARLEVFLLPKALKVIVPE